MLPGVFFKQTDANHQHGVACDIGSPMSGRTMANEGGRQRLVTKPGIYLSAYFQVCLIAEARKYVRKQLADQ